MSSFESDSDNDSEFVDSSQSQSQSGSYDDDIEEFIVLEPCPELQHDIAEIKGHVVSHVGDELCVMFPLDVRFLSSRVATAWGLDRSVPVIISLRDISASVYYRNDRCCVVKMWQQQCDQDESTTNQYGVIPQMQMLLTNYIRTQWNTIAKNNPNMSTLLSMGFDQHRAFAALSQTNNNLDASISMLMDTDATIHLKGFFTRCVDYLRFRLNSLHEFCPLCDERHIFSTPMLKPAVCRRELCAFAFSKLGLMQDSVDGYADQTEVIDLLVAMFRAAAHSARSEIVLNPFPLIYDPKDPDTPVISEYHKHIALTKEVLSGIDLKAMINVSKHKNNSHPLSFALMQWIITSNRSHIVKLDDAYKLPCLQTKYQYLLLSAPPEVEENFSKEKALHGSVWAFHGSRTENWHCILRTGLKNMSGTKGMLNGAAYGPGVYCSPQISLSMGYSAMQHGYGLINTSKKQSGNNPSEESFLDESGFHCVAICEIIKGAEKRHNASVWTIVDDTKIVTRFFIVYPPGYNIFSAQNITSTSADFMAQIKHATSMDK